MPTDVEFWDELFEKGQKYRPLKDEELDAILSRLGTPNTAADIGAGTGSLVLALAKRGIRTTAFDISNVALSKLSSAAADEGLADAIRTVQSDMNDPEFGKEHSASFDVIFMKLAIAFARNRELALQNIGAMLSPKGSLVILTPVLLNDRTYNDRQIGISVPRIEFEKQLREQFSSVEIFSESGDDPNWPLVTYLCTLNKSSQHGGASA